MPASSDASYFVDKSSVWTAKPVGHITLLKGYLIKVAWGRVSQASSPAEVQTFRCLQIQACAFCQTNEIILIHVFMKQKHKEHLIAEFA